MYEETEGQKDSLTHRKSQRWKIAEVGWFSSKSWVCWEAVLHGSPVLLHILWTEALAAFTPDYLFKNVCIVNSLENRDCESDREKIPLLFRIIKIASSFIEEGRFFLQLIIKDLSSLSLGFIGCDANPLCAASIPTPSTLLPESFCLYPTRSACYTTFLKTSSGFLSYCEWKLSVPGIENPTWPFTRATPPISFSSTPSFSYSAPTTLSSLFLKWTNWSPI